MRGERELSSYVGFPERSAVREVEISRHAQEGKGETLEGERRETFPWFVPLQKAEGGARFSVA